MISANKAFTDLLGYTLTELQSMRYIDLVLEEYRQTLVQGIEGIQKRIKKNFSTEVGFTKKDGTIIYTALTIDFDYDKNGAPQHIYAFMNDITERKTTETKLKEHAKELENLNRLMIGRELRMIELKNEIKALKAQLPVSAA